MDDDIKTLLGCHWGSVRFKELREAGITRERVKALIQRGELVQWFRGVISNPRGHPHWAELRSHGHDTTCLTAAKNLGLWTLGDQESVHANYRREASLPPLLQAPGYPSIKLISHKRRYANRVLDVVMSAIRCLPELEAFVIAESAVVLKKITLAELREAVRKSGRVKEIALVERINPTSESMLETVGRYLLEKAGFQVQIQVAVRGLGRLDAMVDGVLGIEFDGRSGHDTPKGYDEDRRRNNVAMMRGVPVLRVTYAQVIHRPHEFIRMVREALSAVTGRGTRV